MRKQLLLLSLLIGLTSVTPTTTKCIQDDNTLNKNLANDIKIASLFNAILALLMITTKNGFSAKTCKRFTATSMLSFAAVVAKHIYCKIQSHYSLYRDVKNESAIVVDNVGNQNTPKDLLFGMFSLPVSDAINVMIIPSTFIYLFSTLATKNNDMKNIGIKSFFAFIITGIINSALIRLFTPNLCTKKTIYRVRDDIKWNLLEEIKELAPMEATEQEAFRIIIEACQKKYNGDNLFSRNCFYNILKIMNDNDLYEQQPLLFLLKDDLTIDESGNKRMKPIIEYRLIAGVTKKTIQKIINEWGSPIPTNKKDSVSVCTFNKIPPKLKYEKEIMKSITN